MLTFKEENPTVNVNVRLCPAIELCLLVAVALHAEGSSIQLAPLVVMEGSFDAIVELDVSC